MGILILLIPLTLGLTTFGVCAFWWAWRHRQFDDLDGKARTLLLDDDQFERKPKNDP